MASLTGTKIKDTYDGLLKVTDNVGINSTKKIITDGLGNNSSVKISSEDFEVGGFFFIDIDGNVPDSKIGIGTNAPTETLHVVGDFRLTARFFDGSNSAGTSGRVLMSTGSATSWSNTFTTAMTFDAGVILNAGIKDYTGATGTAGQVLSSTGSDVEWVSLSEIQGVDGSGTANYIPIWTDSDTLGNSVIYQSSSNIGIGTLSPGSYKLNVFGDFKLDSNGSGYMQSDYGDHRISIFDLNDNEVISFKDLDSNSANQLVVASTGVGINVANPSEKLHVSGEVLFSGTGVRTTKTVGTDSSLEVQNGISIFRTTNIVGWLLDSNSSNHLGLYNWNRNGYVLKIEDNTPAGTVYINASGYIGIATTSPTYKLHVVSGVTPMAKFEGTTNAYVDFTDPSSSVRLQNSGHSYFGTQTNTDLNFKTNATVKMTIQNGGNIGIGTTSPDKKLDVTVDTSDDGVILQTTSGRKALELIVDNGSNGQGTINFYTGTSLLYGRINADSEGLNFDTIANRHTIFKRAGSETMRIDTSSRVGIGTSSPIEKLHVFNAGFPQLNLESNGGSWQLGVSSGNEFVLRKGSSGSDYAIWVESNLNVGIGTTSPANKLEVVGDIRITNANGSNPTDAGSLIFNESGTTWATNIYGFRINMEGSSNYLNFQSANTTTVKDILTLTRDTGRVGIGNTSPSYPLHVYNADAPSDILARFQTADNSTYIQLVSAGSSWQIGATADSLDWYNDNNTSVRMSLLETGNLGIGTTSPAGKLHVYNTSTTSDGDGTATETASGQDSILLYGHGGTNGQTYGSITWMGGNRRRAMISAVAENTDTDFIGLAFYTQGTDGSGDFAESMRITRSGRVGIGTTSPNDKLEIADTTAPNIRMYRSGTGQVWQQTIDSSGRYMLREAASSGGTLYTRFQVDDTGEVALPSYGSGTFTGTATQRLAVDSSGNIIEVAIGSGAVDGSGTANFVTKWSDADTLTNSLIYDDGTNVYVNNGSTDYFGSATRIQLISGASNKYVGIRSNTLYLYGYGNGSDSRLIFGDGSANFGLFSSDTDFNIYNYGTASDAMTILSSNSNVGIGTTSPTTKLDISDSNPFITIQGTSSSYVNGGIQFISKHASTARGLGNFYYCENSDVEWFSGLPYNNNDAFVINRNTGYTVPSSSSSPPGIGASAGTKFIIDSSGKVGIGTTSPSYALDINNDTSTILNLHRPNSSTAAASFLDFTFNTADASSAIYARIRADVETNTNSGQGGDLSFHTANVGTISEVMRITENGRVGIGTSNPVEKLQINSGDVLINNSTISTLKSGGSLYIDLNTFGSYSGRNFRISDNGTSLVNVKQTGEVGIGTTSPSEKLHVSTSNNTVAKFESTDANANIRIGDTVDNTHIGTDGGKTYIGADTSVGGNNLTILSDGKVGIGTGSPSELLELQEQSNNDAKISILKSDGNEKALIGYDNGNGGLLKLYDESGTTNVFVRGYGNSYFNGGNFGIGTTSPLTQLHLSNTNGGAIYIQDSDSTNTYNITSISNGGGNLTFDTRNSTGGFVSTDYQMVKDSSGANYQRWFTQGSERLRITSDGKIGIGTTSPGAKLNVVDSGGAQLQISGWSDSNGANNANGTLYIGNTASYRGVIDYDAASTGSLIISNTWNNDNGDIIFKTKTQATDVEVLRLKGSGKIKMNTYGSGTFTGTATQRLAVDSSGNIIEVPIGSGAVDGSGTANTVTMWSDADTLTDAPITISGNDATFAGNITTGDDGSVIGGDGVVSLYARSTGTVSYAQFQTSSTGSNTTSDGLTVGVNGSTAYVWQRENASLHLGTNDSAALTINSSQNVGIGTTSPSKKLTVDGTVEVQNNALSLRDTSSNLQIKIQPSVGGNGRIMAHNTNLGTNQNLDIKATQIDLYSGSISGGTNVSTLLLDSSNNATFAGNVLIPSGYVGRDSHNRINFDTDDSIIYRVADTYRFRMDSDNFSPYVDSSYDLGTTSKYFRHTYTDEITTTGNATFGGNVTLSSTSPLLHLANTTSTTGKTWRFSSAANGKLYITQESVVDAVTLDHTTGNATFAGDITTTGSSITIDPPSGDAILNLTHSSQSLRIDQNSIRTTTNSHLSLMTNHTLALYIDTSQNIGIGTTAPSHKLNIVTANDTTALGIDIGSNAHFDFSANSTSSYTANFNIDDTGLDIGHNSTSRALNLKTGNSDRLTILGTGNVGIGTTTPSQTLQVSSDSGQIIANFNASNSSTATNNGGAILELQNTNSTNGNQSSVVFRDSNGNGSSAIFGYNADHSDGEGFLTFGTRNSSGTFGEKMRITSGGNVGIGITSPGVPLDVSGIIRTTTSFVGNASIVNQVTAGTSGGNIKFKNNDGVDRAIITDAGKVGIGTTTPKHKLYVSGDIGQTDGSRIWFRGSDSSSATGAQSYIYSNGLNLKIKGDDNVQLLGDGGGIIAHFDYTGNVGIGTTSPSYKLDVSGSLRATGESTFTNNLLFSDTSRIKLGTGQDLQIYHDGSHSYIEDTGTGQLRLKSNSHIQFLSDTNDYHARMIKDQGVELYYDNSKKFETTNTGIAVTGTIASRNIPVLIHTGWGDDTSTTSNLIIPLGNSVDETSVSGADGQHFFIAPSNMKVIKVIMKNVSGSVSSSFTTQFKLYKNGANVTSSSEIAQSTDAITWEPTTANSFVEGDELSLVYQKSATSKYWREVSLTIVLELIHDI